MGFCTVHAGDAPTSCVPSPAAGCALGGTLLHSDYFMTPCVSISSFQKYKCDYYHLV